MSMSTAGLCCRMNAGWRSRGERCRSATRRGITNRKLIETMSRGVADSPLPDRSHHIGSKDFPMPKKNSYRKPPRSGLRAVVPHDQIRLELGWQQIAQGRVQPSLVIHFLDET